MGEANPGGTAYHSSRTLAVKTTTTTSSVSQAWLGLWGIGSNSHTEESVATCCESLLLSSKSAQHYIIRYLFYYVFVILTALSISKCALSALFRAFLRHNQMNYFSNKFAFRDHLHLYK